MDAFCTGSDGVETFTQFLRSQFSEENIEFWLACEEFKTAPASSLQSKAKQIYAVFIDADAPKEVRPRAGQKKKRGVKRIIGMIRFFLIRYIPTICVSSPKQDPGFGTCPIYKVVFGDAFELRWSGGTFRYRTNTESLNPRVLNSQLQAVTRETWD